jgi:hypothetical protein
MEIYPVRNEPNKHDESRSNIYRFDSLGYEVKVNRRVRDYNWFNLFRGGRSYKDWTRQTGFGRVVEFGKLALRFKKV